MVVTNDTEGLGAGEKIEEGVDVVRLPCRPLLSGRLPLPRHNAEHRQLLREVAKRHIDGVLVNARFYPHSLLGMRFARSQGIAPVVLDHGSAYLSLSSPVLDPFVRFYERVITAWGRRYRARYFGISAKSAEWLSSFGIRAEGVIPNAIDAKGYRSAASGRDFRKELGLPPDSFLVSFVGRLIPEKGVPTLVEATRAEPLRSAGITVVLAGDGPLSDEARSAESPVLRVVGRLSREDTAALLLQSDLMCLPSRSEGFCTVLLEASACGCPSLVTDVGGARELILDDRYGRIMSDASSSTILGELSGLSVRKADLRMMGERCRKRVEEAFSWDATASAVEQALEHRTS